jgi:FkbM family methyltransferase
MGMGLHFGRSMVNMGSRLRTFRLGDKLSVAAECFLRGHWNEVTEERADNGEEALLRKIGKIESGHPMTVFDVGANHGQWAQKCLAHCPQADIHCFELVPDTFTKLERAMNGSRVKALNAFGLSDNESQVEATYFPDSDSGSSIEPLPWGLHGSRVTCKTIKGDDYADRNGIKRIDMLKIDVEGHEMRVLRGLENMLSAGRTLVVQFEYGKTWLPPRFQLRDAYDFLSPKGFVIGRLFPSGVAFSEYSMFRDEHFRMGNYIAVHGGRRDMIDILSDFNGTK